MSGVPQGPQQPGRPAPPTRPRRVRGGIRLATPREGRGEIWSASWTGQRWIRLLEQAAQGEKLVEGLTYAREGQAKGLVAQAGAVRASVQGLAPRPCDVRIALDVFTPEQWQQVVHALAAQPLYTAKLLAGDVPANIEDLFAPLGLRLFPAEASEVKVSCTCEAAAPGGAWCEHACCVAYLFAQMLANDPFVIFRLRGLEGQELLEQLRYTRPAGAVGASEARGAVYAPRLAGVRELPVTPLEETLETFWESPEEAEGPAIHIEPPKVDHPLLRRLGASPFQKASFPLVGLLASCYETISKAVLREEHGPEPKPEDDPHEPSGSLEE